MAANEAHYCDCCRNMGHFLCGVVMYRNGKAFRERTFALCCQQTDKDQQNVDAASPLEKSLRTPISLTIHSTSGLRNYRNTKNAFDREPRTFGSNQLSS